MKKFILIVCVAFGCGKPLPHLEGIDLQAWKNDRNGCNHTREKTIEQLNSQKEKLKGLSEDEILKLLGRPDQNELYKRNQKFFHYFLECKNDSSATELSIRFNAMNLAKDVSISAID